MSSNVIPMAHPKLAQKLHLMQFLCQHMDPKLAQKLHLMQFPCQFGHPELAWELLWKAWGGPFGIMIIFTYSQAHMRWNLSLNL